MSRYTKEELKNIIQEYSKLIGRTPKMKEVTYNKDLPPIHQFLKKFNTWNNLLKECDLKINSNCNYSKEYLLNVLKSLATQLKRTPLSDDLNKNKDLPSPKVYYVKFGSWNNALRIAGLKLNVRKDYTKEELLDLLREKAKKLGRSPKIDEINSDKNMPDRDTYSRYFGTFNKALEIAGLEVKYFFRKWTKEDIIKWLRYKYDELGATPGIRDFDADPEAPAKNTARKLFGNWTNAIREAKIPVKRFTSEEELIGILKRLSRKLNKTPTRYDIGKLSGLYSYNPFVRKFGSYTAACLRAGLIPNDGRNNKIWQNWEKYCVKMAKLIYRNLTIHSFLYTRI